MYGFKQGDETQRRPVFEQATDLVYERKFDTAMRQSGVDRFMKRIQTSELTREDNVIFTNKQFDADEIIIDEGLYSYILSDILTSTTVSRIRIEKSHFVKAQRIIETNITLQQHLVINTIKDVGWKKQRHNKIRDFFKGVTYHPCVAKMSYLVDQIGTIVDKLNNSYGRKMYKLTDEEYLIRSIRDNRLVIDDDLLFCWNRELLFTVYKGYKYLLPRVYILMIHNKLCDLISIMILSSYSAGTVFPIDCQSVVISFVLELCHLMHRYKRNFFSISKVLEGLCYAETLLEVEQWKNTEFLVEIVSGLNEIGFDYMDSNLRDYIRNTTASFRHELCCLSKIIGHPLVDMEGGAKEIHKKVTEVYDLTIEQLVLCECYIKQNYIRNHILTGKGWPPVEISLQAPEYLTRAWAKNKDPESREVLHEAAGKTVKSNVLDYLFVTILPNLIFNKLENIIPYLKDKTVSLCRRKIIGQLISEYTTDKERPKWEDTRLLLTYLLHPSLATDHTEYLDQINQGMPIEMFHDYLICRIVPKEKEHKVKFRGFGCKTPQDRARSLVQEVNSKHFLDLFSDEQAMTLSELDLIKRLHTFRRLKDAYAGHEVLYVTLDASSWNNHFRKETVDDLMANTLSKIYNHKIFSRTHEFYQHTLHYVPDSTKSYFWDGQAGGIEGLNQDTWVIVYIAQIKTTLHDFNLKYHILCKGDDFRLAVMIPKKDLMEKTMKQYKDEIVSVISKKAKGLGHVIKVEESFGSARYFMFSKHASIDRVEMPETFRKIMKCHGSNNSFINTLDEYIGSTFSNAHSACKPSPIAIPQYCVALFWSTYYLLRHPIYKNLTDHECVALLLVPSVCGGFPIIYLHNMYVRAESDLLSPFLYIIQYCKEYMKPVFDLLIKFCTISDEKPTSFIQLYKDPYSLPSNRPPLPSAILRKKVIPSLRRLMRNEHVIELFEAVDSLSQEVCVRILDSSDVLVIKLLSRVYQATPAAIIEELVRKFESSRSILELIILAKGRRNAMKVLSTVNHRETKLQQWRLNTLTGILDERGRSFYKRCYSDCPGEFADNIREYSWGKKVIGITMPAVQHLMSYWSPLTSNNHAQNHHFTYDITDSYTTVSTSKGRYFADGHQRPFMGHVTSSGTNAAQLKFVQKNIILSHVTDLLEVHVWSQLAQTMDEEGNLVVGNLHHLVEKLLRLYTSESLDKLLLFQTPYKGGGTLQHHGRVKNFRSGIIPNTCSSFYTQITGSTDTHAMIANSSDHFLFNFLHIYCYSVYVIFSELDVHPGELSSPRVIWGVTNDCKYCNHPIREDLHPITVNLKSLSALRFFPLQTTNVGNQMKEVLKLSLEKQQNQKFLSDPEYQTITFDYACLGVIQHFFVITIEQVKSLQARYAGVTLTDTSRALLTTFVPKTVNREVGLTELKRLDPVLLAKSIIVAVYLCLHDFFFSSVINETSIGVLSNLTYNELPWYTMLSHLYQAGVLMEVMSVIASIAGHQHVYSRPDPAGCSHILATYAIEAVYNLTELPPFILLGTLAPGDVGPALRRYITGWLWVYIKKRYLTKLTIPPDYKLLSQLLGFLCLKPFHPMSYKNLEVKDIEPTMEMNSILELELEEVREIADIDDVLEIAYHDINSISKIYKLQTYDIEKASALVSENITDVYDELMSLQIQARIVSLPAAVSVLRNTSSQIDDTSSSDDINVTWERQFTQFKHSLDSDPLFRKLPKISADDILTTVPRTLNIIRMINRRIYVEFINRVYGHVTHTYSLLLFVFQKIGYPMNARIQNIFWSEIGGGYGSGSAFFSALFHQSHGLYASKPVTNPKMTKPMIALPIAKKNSVDLKYDHCAKGMWDITKPNVQEEFVRIQPVNDIVFCNIDKFESPDHMWEIFHSSFSYYLRTAKQTSMFITTLSNEYYDTFLQIISQISLFTNECYMSQPPFVRCKYNIYLVAFGVTSTLLHTEISKKRYHTVDVAIHNIIIQWLKNKDEFLENPINKPPTIKIEGLMRSDSPIYCLSLLSVRCGITISSTELLRNIIEAHDYWQAWRNAGLIIVEQGKSHIQILLKNLTGEHGIDKNQMADIDFRCTRRQIWSKIFMLEALKFTWAISRKTQSHSIDTETYKNFYRRLVNETMLGEGPGLGIRNMTFLPPSEEDHYIKKYLIVHNTAVEVFELWSRFCHGIEIMLSFAGLVGQYHKFK